MTLDADDLQMMLSEVARFCGQRLVPATRRFERVLALEQLTALTQEAEALGLLPHGGEAHALGLWSDVGDPAAMALSLGILTHVGEASASLAFAWHRACLARQVLAFAGPAQPASELLETAMLPTGFHGFAREALGAWLRDRPGAEGDDSYDVMLRDWLDRDRHAAVLWAPRDWRHLIWPVWLEGRIEWQRVGRGEVEVEACGPLHGLDDLCGFRVRQPHPWPTPPALSMEASRRHVGEVLILDQIGLTAIALGVLKRGWAMASSFAWLRRQGGQLIARHAAVQAMLSDIAAAIAQTSQQLQAFHRPVGELRLADAIALRLSTSAPLVAATHQVMQVHGGAGYMKDVGPERLVRDQNMLRLSGGGVAAMDLLLAALQEGGAS